MSGNFPESAARKAFRQAVADVAGQAKEALPANAGRIDSAVKIVLAGDVEMLPDGKAKVASQSNGTTTYYVVNGDCECRDFPKAPAGWCKHKLARALHKRATQLVQQRLDASSNGQAGGEQEGISTNDTLAQASTPPAPAAAPVATSSQAHHEAPASMNTYVTIAGYKVQVTFRTLPGEDEMQLHRRMEAYLKQFPTPEPPQAATGKPAEPQLPEGWCRRHDLQMDLQRSKDPSKPGTWYSHRLADGSWCRGK